MRSYPYRPAETPPNRIVVLGILAVMMTGILLVERIQTRALAENLVRRNTHSEASKRTFDQPINDIQSYLDWKSGITWIGNTWIPPRGAKLYTPAEIQAGLREHSILILGDSTGRRFWATCQQIINHGANATTTGEHNYNNSTIDESPDSVQNQPRHISRAHAYADYDSDPNYKGEYVHRCEKWSADPTTNATRLGAFCRSHTAHDGLLKSFDFLGLPCINEATYVARESASPNGVLWNITKDYSIVIVAVGIWNAMDPRACKCPRHHDPNATAAHYREALDAWHDVATDRTDGRDTTVFWRTSGFNDQNRTHELDFTLRTNGVVAEAVAAHGHPNRFAVLDFGGVILPRSFGEDRVHGDRPNHYGAEARLLLLQMLMNSLDQRGLL